MIVDFIKSWLYYPKLKKYLKSIGFKDGNVYGNRWEYAKWHCRVIKERYCHEMEEDKKDSWTSLYDKEPIEK